MEQEIIPETVVPIGQDGETGFVAYTRMCIGRMQDEGRYDAASKLNMYLRKFIAFLGQNEVPFKDFDSLLIRNYHTWLKNQELGQNTISLYIRNLKRVYRLAVTNGVTCERYPFQSMDVSYRVKKDRNRLTPKDVIRLRYMDVSGLSRSAVFARDMFLFALLAHGMSGSDLFYLTASDIRDGILTYTSKATGKTENVPLGTYLQSIIDRYSRPDTLYLFPIITSEDPQEQWRQHDAAIHTINRNLKKVGRQTGLSFPLNMTVARHSWESMTQEVNINELI